MPVGATTECHPYRTPLRLFGFRDSVELITVGDKERAVGGNRSAVYRASHVYFGDYFLLFCCLQNRYVAVFIAQIHFPIHDKRRPPDGGKHVMNPEGFACLHVQTVQESAEVSIENHAVVYRAG